jgi:hypothetical protein
MKHTIDTLVSQFERGSLTRRQLVQALLVIAASPALAQEVFFQESQPSFCVEVELSLFPAG